MVRRLAKVLAALVVAGFVLPQAVEAASAFFTSSSATTPAVKGQNTAAGGGAKAVEGYASTTTNDPTFGVFGTTRSSSGAGVFGQNLASLGLAWGLKGQTTSPDGRALEGYASNASSGASNHGAFGVANGGADGTSGVFGWARSTGSSSTSGVLGRSDSSNGAGIVGIGGEFGLFSVGTGDGVFGLGGTGSFAGVEGFSCLDAPCSTSGAGVFGVVSDNDLGVTGHFVAGGTNVAGTCNIPADVDVSAAECTFQSPWPMSGSRPLVVATPESDPGIYYWVELIDDGSNYTGIKMHRGGTPPLAVTFDYHVIGIDTNIAPGISKRATSVRRGRRYAP